MRKPADPNEELHANVKRRLAAQNHTYTKGRRDLVAALAATNAPITLPDLIAAHPTLSSSSAYRNLDILTEAGIARRIHAGSDFTHFELAEPLRDHHHHLICTDCGDIADIHLTQAFESQIDTNLAAAARQAKFTPTHHSLDLHGLCSACR